VDLNHRVRWVTLAILASIENQGMAREGVLGRHTSNPEFTDTTC